MEGLFELRPGLPRYKSIWDLNIEFNYFRGRPAVPELSLKELTLRACPPEGQAEVIHAMSPISVKLGQIEGLTQ